MEYKRVVVTGLGALTPIGNNVQEYWNGLINGVSGAANITNFDATNFKSKFACEVKNFNPTDYIDRKEVRRLDPYAIFAMVAADEAIKDSELDLEKIDKPNAGVVWGSGIGGITAFAEEIMKYKGPGEQPRFSPFFITKMISNIVPGHLSIKYGFMGPNYTMVSACASALHAIFDSFNYIRTGYADIILTGGSEASVNEPGVAGFNAMHAISTRNDDPKTASRPFDVDRDGFVIGEGGAALLLEEYEHAKKRGARIYAELIGGGISADAHHITAPHPEGEGASMVMQKALKDAGIEPTAVDYINLHGTSTGLGDLAEPKAVKKVFGEHAYKLSMSATKSMTGHLLGAAGAIESIASILALINGIIPPTVNQFNLDPEIDPQLDFTFNKAKKRDISVALNNSFGFGGQNATILFKKID
jgi:3-oxoacyl-[acyl-carrier-protein] synthase II